MLKVLVFLAALIAMGPPSQPRATSAQTTASVQRTLPSGRVTMTLPADGLPGTADVRQVAIAGEAVTLPAGRSLAALLASRGVQPTPDAIGVFYDLNPTVDDIRTLRPDMSVVLPRVTGDQFLRAAMGRGYQVRLSNDAAAAKAATASSAQLQQMTERVTSVSAERFRNPADKERLIRSFTSGKSLVARTISGGFPLAQKVLRQTTLNAGIMKATADSALGGSAGPEVSGPSADPGVEQVGPETLDRLDDAVQGQQAIVKDLEQGGSALGLVEVHTVDPAGNPRRLLRVSYAPKLDPSSVTSFRGLTSPSAETLVVGADFTLSVPGADKTVTIRVDKKNQPITLKIIQP